jgi:hypothetical protein
MLVTTVQAPRVVRNNHGVRPLKNTFNMFLNAGGCNPVLSIKEPRNALLENYHSSGKLRKHPVDNIGTRNWRSFEDNDEAVGENLEEGFEVTLSIGDLLNEGRWRFGSLVKPAIERRGEDDEYTQI